MNLQRHPLLWAAVLTLSSFAFAEDEPTDLPSSTKRASAKKAALAELAAETPRDESTEALGDRVRSFQPKEIIKRGRFALGVSGLISLNDAFQSKLGGAVSLSYYLHDTLSVGIRGGIIRILPERDLAVARQNFQLAVVASQPNWLAMGDLEFSPIYGKFRFAKSIIYVDGYLLAGAGTVIHRTAEVGFEAGGGLRFVVADFFAVNLAWINTFYVDKPVGSSTAFLQNLMTLNLGFALYLPFSSPERSKP